MRVCRFREKLKNATQCGLAADRVQPVQEYLAIHDANRCGTKRWKPGSKEQSFAQLPHAPGDYAGPVIADVFNPRTLRVVRITQQFKLSQAADESPIFNTSPPHLLFNLLLPLKSSKSPIDPAAVTKRVENCEGLTRRLSKTSEFFHASGGMRKIRAHEIRIGRSLGGSLEKSREDSLRLTHGSLVSACRGPDPLGL